MLHVEYVRAHLLVAALIAAVAAGSGNDDGARDFRRASIELNDSALHMEGSVHFVSGASERKGNIAGRGICCEVLLLGEGKRCNRQRKDEDQGSCCELHGS